MISVCKLDSAVCIKDYRIIISRKFHVFYRDLLIAITIVMRRIMKPDQMTRIDGSRIEDDQRSKLSRLGNVNANAASVNCHSLYDIQSQHLPR